MHTDTAEAVSRSGSWHQYWKCDATSLILNHFLSILEASRTSEGGIFRRGSGLSAAGEFTVQLNCNLITGPESPRRLTTFALKVQPQCVYGGERREALFLRDAHDYPHLVSPWRCSTPPLPTSALRRLGEGEADGVK